MRISFWRCQSEYNMKWTQKPTCFQDFVHDAEGEAPVLIYEVSECPEFPDVLGRGSDCYMIHRESDSCPFEDHCLESTVCCNFDSENPTHILIVPPSFLYIFPGHWVNCLNDYGIRFDWIVTSPETIKRLLQEKEPLAALWQYRKGPRQWSQHGGDEDWTVVVRKSVYVEDELYLKNHLDYCGTECEDEEDFRVYTGAHA